MVIMVMLLVNNFKGKLKCCGPTDCPDDLFNNMKLYCAKYIRVCKEINISFMPQEAQVSVVKVCSFRSFL